jgi:hypothetical protein
VSDFKANPNIKAKLATPLYQEPPTPFPSAPLPIMLPRSVFLRPLPIMLPRSVFLRLPVMLLLRPACTPISLMPW